MGIECSNSVTERGFSNLYVFTVPLGFGFGFSYLIPSFTRFNVNVNFTFQCDIRSPPKNYGGNSDLGIAHGIFFGSLLNCICVSRFRIR